MKYLLFNEEGYHPVDEELLRVREKGPRSPRCSIGLVRGGRHFSIARVASIHERIKAVTVPMKITGDNILHDEK